MEKSNSLHRAKIKLGIKTNEELSKLLNLSKTTIASSLNLRGLLKEDKKQNPDLYKKQRMHKKSCSDSVKSTK